MWNPLLTPANINGFFVFTPMKLLMYIENDLIDSVSIEADKIIFPGYVGEFIKMFREKHATTIQQSIDEPEFLIHKSPSLCNNDKK